MLINFLSYLMLMIKNIKLNLLKDFQNYKLFQVTFIFIFISNDRIEQKNSKNHNLLIIVILKF